jgi:tetratricopeptide (TPR) repeat protein
MHTVDNCDNCGRTIGRLEQPHVWRTHVVCVECHTRLSAPAPSAKKAPAPPPMPKRPEAPKPVAPPMLLCGVCGRYCPFGDVVSENGRLICRTCSYAAAAARAQQLADSRRKTVVVKSAVAAGLALLLVAIGVGTYLAVRTRPVEKTADRSRSSPATPAGGASTPADPTAATAAPEGQSAPTDLRPASPEPETSSRQPTALFVADVAPGPSPGSTATQGGAPPVESVSPAATKEPQRSAPAAAPANPTSSPAPPPATQPAPPAAGSAEALVAAGKALLARGKFAPALEQFSAAIRKDNKNPDACHGAALCYQGMGNRDLATERLERAVALYNPPNRAAVYNLAVALLRENPMRAAKFAGEYLEREGAPPDEPLHNVMGKALFSVSRQGRQNKAYAEAEDFYYKYNQKLEAARGDGRKRWGSEWVSGPEATAKWERYRSREKNVEAQRTAVDRATKGKADAWDKLYDMEHGMRLNGTAQLRMARERYANAARQEIAAREQLKRVETEFNSTERPPMPQVIKPAGMDETVPPPVTSGPSPRAIPQVGPGATR